MANRVKIEDTDRISDLHDSILSHILSFLSTKEAVRTSVLCTRWRYYFTLVSNLDIDLDEFRSSYERYIYWLNTCDVSFRSFVDRMMFSLNNMTNLDKFCLKGTTVEHDSDSFSRWLSAAFRRGVKHVDLSIHFSTTTLRFVLFTSRTLTTLKLAIGPFELYVPKGAHFPNLKTLHLKLVNFLNDDSVQSIFSGCTSLEDLVLVCDIKAIRNLNISHHLLKRLTIMRFLHDFCFTLDTPNLEYFEYEGGNRVTFSHETLQSLVKVNINIYFLSASWDNHATAAFFRAISKVRSLVLSSYSVDLLFSCNPLPMFATLVELKLDRLSLLNWGGLEALLSNSPELKELVFPGETHLSLPEEGPSILLSKLKVIEISNFIYDEDGITKSKYILKNGGALEKLTIRSTLYKRYSDDEKLEIYKVLMASPRKSKQCCIYVL